MAKEHAVAFAAIPMISAKSTLFHLPDKTIVVELPGKLMRQLVKLCDGSRTNEEVVSSLQHEWNEMSLIGLTADLQRQGILVRVNRLGESAWKMVENPSRFGSVITESEVAELADQARRRHKDSSSAQRFRVPTSVLGELLKVRRSVRFFSGEAVDLDTLVRILWNTYGEIDTGDITEHRRTTPSAGALFPLIIHVGLFAETSAVQPAIYRVHMASPETVGFEKLSDDINRLMRSFLDPAVLKGAYGVIMISGSFRVTSEKYANRGLLYTVLEAGHAAQNTHLAATEAGVSTVEIGGFVETLLSEALDLPREYQPLTTVVFGYESAGQAPEVLAIDWAIPMAGPYRPHFAVAMARVAPDLNEDWAYGRDKSPSHAQTKAVAEAIEWGACGCVPSTLTRAPFGELPEAVDPESIIRFHPAQYRLKAFPFERFNREHTYEWARGSNELTSEPAEILADLVYFPYYSDGPPYGYANSSGVAAHPSYQEAVERSVLELIERDAFMIAYLARIPRPVILYETLPKEIQGRVQDLRELGFQVWVIDHTLDLAPVITVLIQHEELRYTTCASCSSFDLEYALDHALMEAEASVLARLQNGPAVMLKPRDVVMPFDHGALYEQPRYFQKADFLAQGRGSVVFGKIGLEAPRSWQALVDIIVRKGWRLITVPLHLSDEYGGNKGLHVIRSFIPGLVPMTFGYRQDPAGMDRIYELATELEGAGSCYRTLTKFPHPFA